MYERHGLHIVDVRHNSVNGGSIRVTAMKTKTFGTSSTIGISQSTIWEATEFAERVRRWKEVMNNLLDMPSVRGTELWGLGASTKGSVMLQYLGNCDRFVAIGDRNVQKIGTYQTGTWIPVLGEAEMRKARPPYIVNLIWGFRDEVLEREKDLRSRVELSAGSVIINPLPNPEFVL
jgi:NDP-4-keto-2,6-dideoxyhexose 3-C-methyltransferase